MPAAVKGISNNYRQRTQHGAGPAMTVCVAVVGAIAVLCLGLVWLPSRSVSEEPH